MNVSLVKTPAMVKFVLTSAICLTPMGVQCAQGPQFAPWCQVTSFTQTYLMHIKREKTFHKISRKKDKCITHSFIPQKTPWSNLYAMGLIRKTKNITEINNNFRFLCHKLLCHFTSNADLNNFQSYRQGPLSVEFYFLVIFYFITLFKGHS